MFGYDTGIISGALLHLREDLGLTSRVQEMVGSVILLGAMLGAPVSGRPAARHGRHKVVIAVAVVSALGAGAAAAASGVNSFAAAFHRPHLCAHAYRQHAQSAALSVARDAVAQ
ncbi:MFS transporter [Streptomyces sp. NPDC055089]